MRDARRAWALLQLLLPLLLQLHIQQSSAYSETPLLGQGVPPPGTVKIYLSVVVERVLRVDQVNYGFAAIVYLHMAWREPRAKPAIDEFSVAQNDPGECHARCSAAVDRCLLAQTL